MINIILIILFLFSPVLLSAQETEPTDLEQPVYETILIEGAASITIDGDLSDWKDIEAPEVSLMNSHRIQLGSPKYLGLEDLDASFRAFADLEYLYVAFKVKDDAIVFGESSQIFGQGLRDDAVEVYFDGDPSKKKGPDDKYDINDGQVRVTRGVDREIRLEGQISSFRQIPYGWEELGIRAGLKEQDGGYTVEVCIPVDVLGLEKFTLGTTIGFSAAVTDDDDGGDQDDKFCWSNDPKDIIHRRTAYFGRLTLISSKPGLKSASKPGTLSKSAVVRRGEENRLIITLTERPAGRSLRMNALKSDIKTLRNRLNELKARKVNRRELIVTAGLILAKTENKWDEAALEAIEVMKEAADASSSIKLWLSRQRHLAREYLLHQSASGLSDAVVNRTLEIFGTDGTLGALYRAGSKLTDQRKYERSMEYNQKILELNPDSKWQVAAYYNLGYNYKMNAYKKRRQWEKEYQSFNKSFAVKPTVRYDSIEVKFLQHLDKAIESFTKVIEMADQVPSLRKVALSYYELGSVYSIKRDGKKAVELWKVLLKRFNAADLLYLHNGKISKRERWFLPEALYKLGGIAAREGNYSLARKYYKRIIQEYPKSKIDSDAKLQLKYLETNNRN